MGETSTKPVTGLVELKHPERSRTYYFPNADVLHLENVTHLEVRSSGKHRVQTKEGKKVFVNTGWLWIDIDVDEWSL